MSLNDRTDQASKRLLRFLQRGEARLGEAAKVGHVVLDGGDRGVVCVEMSVLRSMLDAGYVCIVGDVVRSQATAAQQGGLNAELAGDTFDAGKHLHETVEVETGEGRQSVLINVAESPLALLWRHKSRNGGRFLTLAEFRAGERLRADYSSGQIMPRLGVNWNAVGASGNKLGEANGMADITDAVLAARRKVEDAITAVGPELAGVLIDICCFLKGLERVETERSWPARSAKVVLKSALSALARHYEPPRRRTSASAILHWGAGDYRPSVR